MLIITGVASTATRPEPTRGAVCSSPTVISAEPFMPTFSLERSTAGTASPMRRGDRRRAVGVERLDRLEAPGVALLALLLGPHDRLPVGRQDQPRAGIGDLDAVAARLVDIKEERLLDRVLVRASLDEHAVLQEHVGGEQHLL